MAGPGFGAIAGVDNYKARAGNGLGPRTQIVVTDAAVADQAALDALVAAAGAVHTVAGIAGSIGGVMHVALQGGPDADGATYGQAVSIVADFTE